MTGKDTDSMATVQIKPDYAASEVYSTASEAPPLGLFSFNPQAYKRQSNSVKIAKITAFTIIVSSFILGTFILASSYLQAKASCDQVQALDSVLEKELMLETLQQVNKELPRAEALLGRENNEDADLQNLDKDVTVKKVEIKKQHATPNQVAATASDDSDSSDSDNSYSDVDDAEEIKYPGKVPLELDLSDLAAALLQNNKRSRMNCVVERKHAEEIVDSPSKTVALPFGVNLTTDPKKARITGERISIYCEGGNENKDQENNESSRNNNREEEEDNDEEIESNRPMFIPYQRIPIPFGQIPQRFPLTHMPQRMMPPMPPMSAMSQESQAPPQQSYIRQMPPPFQHLPMRPPMPPQVMQAPHPDSQQSQQNMYVPQTVRIHVQQIPIREIHMADDMPVQIPSQQQELPHLQIQRLPLGVALQRAGITAEDLRNIQRMAEDRITDELRRLAAEEAAESAESNNNSSNNRDSEEADDSSADAQMSSEQEHIIRQQQQQQQQQRQQQQLPQLAHPQQPAIAPEESMRMQQVPPQRLILQPLPEQPRDTMTPPMPDQPQMMQYGRANFGRSLAQPVRIPVPILQPHNEGEMGSSVESERPHFVQPRSV
ncbi:putative mediator of RNA polymerase II transcription subunit 26 isoform X1 [Zeugodacus cucurbitae]|uniref:putative mediator of RNA polymerase II transcription subunit 26 isoform X1 n=1 Tax=Zeugodacus cucurbitae TaxID=28588 RepID=UPI0005968CB4|nr:putative mediator of RNA polymerase II transcription subunit 26 isoform X1 [Zeugodacus cucurbitae]